MLTGAALVGDSHDYRSMDARLDRAPRFGTTLHISGRSNTGSRRCRVGSWQPRRATCGHARMGSEGATGASQPTPEPRAFCHPGARCTSFQQGERDNGRWGYDFFLGPRGACSRLHRGDQVPSDTRLRRLNVRRRLNSGPTLLMLVRGAPLISPASVGLAGLARDQNLTCRAAATVRLSARERSYIGDDSRPFAPVVKRTSRRSPEP